MPNFLLEKLKALPQRADEVWYAGLIRLPGWETDEQDQPHRLYTLILLNGGKGTVHASDPLFAEQITPDLAVTLLVEMASNRKLAGHRPGLLLANDSSLAERLTPLLAEAAIRVRHEPLPPPVQEILDQLQQKEESGMPPGALTGKGVTVDAMRSFAQAAKEFTEAAPWQYLSDSDLIHVESPKPPKGFEYLVVMGEGEHIYGLSFFGSSRHYDDMIDRGPSAVLARGAWVMYLNTITEMPIADADLWEDHQLPVASPDAYPLPHKVGPGNQFKRPDTKQLAFVEGLLRVLASTTEAEMDAGRWTRTAETFAGPKDYTLTLPDLLEPVIVPTTLYERDAIDWPGVWEEIMDEIQHLRGEQPELDPQVAGQIALQSVTKAIYDAEAEELDEGESHEPDRPLTAPEQAEYLADEAGRMLGLRTKAMLARMALRLDPDCTSACVTLAELSVRLEQARDLYARAVAAAERRLDPEFIREHGRHFREHPELEAYVYAKGGLASCLADLKHYDEAIELWFELLQIDPDDQENIRHLLLPRLLQLGHTDRAEDLWNQYPETDDASWKYSGALAAYRRKPDSPEAGDRLTKALADDKELADWLLQSEQPPAASPEQQEQDEFLDSLIDTMIGPDDEDSEEEAWELLKMAWLDTPGALEWLRAHRPVKAPKKRGKRTRK